MRRYLLLLVLALLVVGCSTSSTIANNLSEREANEIVVLLASRGIDAEKVPAPVATTGAAGAAVKWNITVPAARVTDSLSILNQAGLPRVQSKSLLDLFGSQGLVPSALQDRIRYQEGLSDQIAATIRKMDGIIDANVQITMPQDEDSTEPLTASVYVKHRGILDNPNSLAITKIKRLVASAIPNLTIEDVSVVSDRAIYADISLDPGGVLAEDKHYVSIWGVAVAEESASWFRVIFYTFIILLFILLCALTWIVWKCLPIINQKGVVSLVHPQQYVAPSQAESAVEGEEPKADELEEE